MFRIIQIMVFIPAVSIMLSHCESFEPERKMLLETIEVQDISLTSCSIYGYIYDVGEEGIKEHGFCWALMNTSKNPTIENNRSQEGPLDKPGKISSRIDGLSGYGTYYIRAYSISYKGEVAYGNVLIFDTYV